jgi:hypothetical protein
MKIVEPFKTKKITRRELPSYERKGCLAQELAEEELAFAIFHSSSTDIERLSGLPVMANKELLQCRVGIEDTVVVGGLRDGKMILNDLLMLEQRAQRKFPWKQRLEILQMAWKRFPEDVQVLFPIARTWGRGLLKAFDDVQKGGGAGLLLRVPGEAEAIQCTGR